MFMVLTEDVQRGWLGYTIVQSQHNSYLLTRAAFIPKSLLKTNSEWFSRLAEYRDYTIVTAGDPDRAWGHGARGSPGAGHN